MRPRQSTFNPMGYEDPIPEIEMPEWARPIIYTWDEAVNECAKHIKATFEDFENRLFSNIYAYIQEGIQLAAIRYKKLYEEKGVYSFQEYCNKFYPKSYQNALNTILASQIGWELLCDGFNQVPLNVSQALALSKTILTDRMGKRDITGSWRWIVQRAGAVGKKITVGFINFLVNPGEKEEIVKVPIPKSKWKKFEQKAKKLGFNPNTTLQNLMEDFTEDDEENLSPDSEEPEPEIKMKKACTVEGVNLEPWWEDLDSLLLENPYLNNNYDTT